MEMTDIRRVSLGKAPDVNIHDASLKEEAKELLGYTSPEQTSVQLPPLLRALQGLEIEILDASDVGRYMIEKRYEAEKAEFARLVAEAGANARNHVRMPFLRWTDTQIASYRGPIPEFVLNKAVQLKRAVPEVELEIYYMEDNPDPFLVAKIGWSESYFIEVWDESGFERR